MWVIFASTIEVCGHNAVILANNCEIFYLHRKILIIHKTILFSQSASIRSYAPTQSHTCATLRRTDFVISRSIFDAII